MDRLKDGFIMDLKSRCSFSQIASKYLELTKRGNSYWARCPFHYEKTPSFAIDEYEGFYHCFGCGESGDIVQFVRKMENLSFMEAVEFLANAVGMEVEYDKNVDAKAIAEKNKEKKEVLKVLNDAKEFYKRQIYQKTAVKAQNYLRDRKINRASLENFEIGYSPNFKAIVRELNEQGYDNQIMVTAGIAAQKDDKVYDAIAERLVFPIYNNFSEVIGFSGRILDSNLDVPKYKNTRQTVVFDKSRAIFGLKQVLDAKREQRFNSLILAEGQIDVIMLHQFGFQNAVATQGTALTEQHAALLKKICDNILVCYDGDNAGQKATFRALDILSKAGLSVKVITIPSGQDPDEFLKKNGKEAFQKLIDDAEELMDYKLRSIAHSYNMNSNDQRTKFLKQAIDLIRELPSLAEADVYVRPIAKYANVSENVVRESLTSTMSTLKKEKKVSQEELKQFTENFADANQKADKIILASMIHKKGYVTYDQPLAFINTNYQRLYQLIIKERDANAEFKISELFDHFDFEQDKDIAELLNYPFSKNEEKDKQEYLNSLNLNRIRALEIEMKDLETLYKNATDLSKRTEFLMKIGEISKELTRLKTAFIN